MTVYRPCAGCRLEGEPCQKRTAVSKQIAGLRVGLIGFRCEDRIPRFTPGEPVSVRTMACPPKADEYGGQDDVVMDVFPGTFIKYTKTASCVVHIDPGTPGLKSREPFAPLKNDMGYCNVRRSAVEHRPGKHVKLCPICSNVDGCDRDECEFPI